MVIFGLVLLVIGWIAGIGILILAGLILLLIGVAANVMWWNAPPGSGYRRRWY